MMRHTKTPPPHGVGSILADEVMTMREAGRRLGLGRQGLCDLQRQGLRTVTLGKTKYLIGRHLIEFCEQLIQQGAAP